MISLLNISNKIDLLIGNSTVKAIEQWSVSMTKISTEIHQLCETVNLTDNKPGLDSFYKEAIGICKVFDDINTNLVTGTVQTIKNEVYNGIDFVLKNTFQHITRKSEERVATEKIYQDHKHQLYTYGRQQEVDKKTIINKLLDKDQEKLTELDTELFVKFDLLEKDQYKFLTTNLSTLLSSITTYFNKSNTAISGMIQFYGSYEHISIEIEELRNQSSKQKELENKISNNISTSYPDLFKLHPTISEFKYLQNDKATIINPAIVEPDEIDCFSPIPNIIPSPKRPQVIRTVIAESDYQTEDDDEISFIKGEYITILEMDDSGWWKGNCNGKIGYFPECYVKPA